MEQERPHLIVLVILNSKHIHRLLLGKFSLKCIMSHVFHTNICSLPTVHVNKIHHPTMISQDYLVIL